MSKIIIKNRYGVVPNSLLNDTNITFKAKGVYAYIQSKPEAWDFSVERISCQTKEGLTSVRMALKELEDAGYLIREKYRNNRGHLCYSYQLLHTVSIDLLDKSAFKAIQSTADNPTLDNPTLDNPTLDNRMPLVRKKESNKEDSKKEYSFEEFWSLYGKKVGKEKAKQKWSKLKDKEKEEVLLALPAYIQSRPDAVYRKDPERYLSHRVWEDEIVLFGQPIKREVNKEEDSQFELKIPDKW